MAILAVSVAQSVAVLTGVGAAAGEDRNRGGAQIVATRSIACVLATSVYGLNDSLGVRAIIRFDGSGTAGSKDSRRERERVEIRSFGN